MVLSLPLFYLNDHHESPTTLCLDIVVRGMVADVAVDQPLAQLARFPDDIAALAGGDIHGVGKVAGSRFQGLTVHGDYWEMTPVDVHGMDKAITPADEVNFESLTKLHRNGVGGGIRSAGAGEEIRLRTIHRHGGVGESLAHQPFLQLHGVFMLRVKASLRLFWVDNQRAIEA